MAAGDGKVPIDACVGAGYRFMASSLAVTFPAAALIAVIAGAAQTLIEPAISPNTSFGWLLFVIAQVGTIAYAAFLLRLALREDASGFFGLKLGADEWRMLGVALAVGFLIMIIIFVAIFAISLVMALAMVGGGGAPPPENDPAAAADYFAKLFAGPNGFLFIGVALFFGGLLVWVGARLSLVYPATIGEQRMMAFSTFSWTKGNALRIIAVILLIALPLAVAVLVGASLIGALIGAATGDVDAVFTPKAGAAVPHALFMFVASLGQLAFMTPALMGAYAYLYKGLRPPDLPMR